MTPSLFYHFAAACTGGDFLGFTKWYAYLTCQTVNGAQSPQINNINDVWAIVAAVIELLLRIAALAAVVFIVWGGVQYTTSQGDPGKTTQARGTILNALVGLVIAILSAVGVSFIARSFN